MRIFRFLLGSLALFLTTVTHAAFVIPNPTPQSFEEIKNVTDTLLPEELQKAQCGGRREDLSVGTDPGPGGMISLVIGAPGRAADPLGNLQSGMARRVEEGEVLDDGFQFPSDLAAANGFATACLPKEPLVSRQVWAPLDRIEQGRYVAKEFDNPNDVPYFEDPPCTWGPERDEGAPHTPERCAQFCSWLNEFTYEDCQVFRRTRDDDGWECVAVGQKYLCSEQWKTTPEQARRIPDKPITEHSSQSSETSMGEESSSSEEASASSSESASSESASESSSKSSSSESASESSSKSSSSEEGSSSSFQKSSEESSESSSEESSSESSFQFSFGKPGDESSSESSEQFSFGNPTGESSSESSFQFSFGKPGDESSSESSEQFSFGNPIFPPDEEEVIIDIFELILDEPEPWPVGTFELDAPVGPQSRIQTRAFMAQLTDGDGAEENDEEVDEENTEESSSSERPEQPTVDSDDDHLPNCARCVGAGCRCPGPGCIRIEERPEQDNPVPAPARDQKTFYSFEREYSIHTERGALTPAADVETPQDVLQNTDIAAACYGFYEEFDPKFHTTVGPANENNPGDRSRRCVIDFPHKTEELRTTQHAVGLYTPVAGEDDSITVRDQAQNDLWYPILGGMSFLRSPDLRSAFLRPDRARMRAVSQRWDQLYAQNGLQRATDDTVTNETGDERYLTTYIQKLQQEMSLLLSPPVVRLRVPAAWAGILRSLPVVEGGSVSSAVSVVPAVSADDDPRNKSIDVQIAAGDGVLETLTSAVQTLFTVREAAVHVVIPLGSPLQYRNDALKWKTAVRRWEALEAAYPSEVWLLIATLEKYANDIEKYREMRAELSEALVSALAERDARNAAIADWLTQNENRYQMFLAQRTERMALAPNVRDIQRALTRFSDQITLPFCRSELFTTPIYSLLHGWYPGSPELRPQTTCTAEAGMLPLLCLPEEQDLVVDLTMFAAQSTPVTIPVLHPIAIELNIPKPPADGEPPPSMESLALPDLPPLPRIDPALFARLQRVEVVSTPPVFTPPVPIDLDRTGRSLAAALEIFEGRNASYDQFIRSIDGGSDPDEPLACPSWNAFPCIHVEMDLEERLTRLTAHPGVFLQEDLQVQGLERNVQFVDDGPADDCDPADHLCTPPTRSVLRPPATGWQVVAPRGGGGNDEGPLTQIRTTVRRLTIDDDGAPRKDPDTDLAPPYKRGGPALMPVFSIPEDIDLLPPATP